MQKLIQGVQMLNREGELVTADVKVTVIKSQKSVIN